MHYIKAPSLCSYLVLCQTHDIGIVTTPPCTHLDPQTQQVMHCAAHATGGSSVERSVGFLVLAVHLCSAGHQQLHHLQVTCARRQRVEKPIQQGCFNWALNKSFKKCALTTYMVNVIILLEKRFIRMSTGADSLNICTVKGFVKKHFILGDFNSKNQDYW